MTGDNHPKLKVIQGGLQDETRIGSVRIIASPKHAPPFQPEAVVCEEDTYLVLSADITVTDPGKHIVRIMTDLINTSAEKPGTVVVKGKNPFMYLAIIHDFNLDPTWKEEWISEVLDNVFKQASDHEISTLALPMLGTVHGSLDGERFACLLKRSLEKLRDGHPSDLWLIVSEGASRDVIKMLEGL